LVDGNGELETSCIICSPDVLSVATNVVWRELKIVRNNKT
jgi:hypothetical protein